MFTRKRTPSAPISDRLALALLIAGPALFIWGQQSQGDPFELMIADGFASYIPHPRSEVPKETVGDSSVTTGPETGAACADYVAENEAIIQAEVTRLKLTFLASIAGIICWCAGILIVAHRVRRPERTAHSKPTYDAACAVS